MSTEPSFTLADLVHGTRKFTDEDLRRIAHFSKVSKAIKVRLKYKKEWPWGAAAEYLYGALIHALGLVEEEEELLQLAKRRPGRKEERELAAQIYSLRAEGKTVPQIRRILAKKGKNCSCEAIESYLKSRRKQRMSYDS